MGAGDIDRGSGEMAMSTRAEPGAEVTDGRYAHLAGFFATRAHLVAAVVDLIFPALREGDGAAVVIAAPDHLSGITAALEDAGIDPESDRCVLLDVDAVLASVLSDGEADRDRFRATLGAVLDEHLDAARDVRVYAELAGRLWEGGEVTTAMHIEGLADELARERSFVLLCAYPTELFDDDDVEGSGVREVCAAHTDLIHGELSRTGTEAGAVGLGEVLQQETVARDLDHQAVRRERDALRRALHEAADRARDDRQRTAMLAHDLRAPTTVIAGLTGVLQRRVGELDPARVADFLATIVRNTERIEGLIDDILTVARLESDGFRYDLAPVDLRGVVEQVASEVCQATARIVDVAAQADLPPALADAARQEQVLHNLLSNAAKFSPAGTPISVRIEGRGDRLLVHVRDQGRGIAAHEVDRLFEPFARLDSSESNEVTGSGLGLYITRTLVEGQGGTIDIASTPGQGTTVTYTVPIADTS